LSHFLSGRIGDLYMKNILVFAEQREGEIKKSALENISLGKKLAADTGSKLITIIIGPPLNGLTEILANFGAEHIYCYENEDLHLYNSEQYAQILSDAALEHEAELIILGATAMGKDLAPRTAVKLNATLASDCISLNFENGELRIIRPMYAGKIRATIILKSEIKIVTVRPNVYRAEENPVTPAEIKKIPVQLNEAKAKVKEILTGSKDKIDVTEADIIVSGGRGLKGPENFHLIKDLAKKLGAAQGASRAVVDAGWRPYEEQVGQTGKTVSPSLYVAVGISGAIQHLAGMSSSKFIVAINKDPEAPIFKVADYGIVGDAFEVVPKLIESL
jgi:electron transfer flavoprotein alpha subunit